MKIKWKDFAISCLIWILLFLFFYGIIRPFQYSIPPKSLDSMVLTLLASCSLSQTYYFFWNKKIAHAEAFAVAFLIPFVVSISYLLLYLTATPEDALGHQMIRTSCSEYFVGGLLMIFIISTLSGFLGILLKFVLLKILKQ